MESLPVQSSPSLVRALKWPILLFLAFTSLPAGLLPFEIPSSYRQLRELDAVNPRLRDQQLIDRIQARQPTYAALSISLLVLQAAMTWIAWRKWNDEFLAFRGAGWFAILQATFTVGVATGVFILCSTR